MILQKIWFLCPVIRGRG